MADESVSCKAQAKTHGHVTSPTKTSMKCVLCAAGSRVVNLCKIFILGFSVFLSGTVMILLQCRQTSPLTCFLMVIIKENIMLCKRTPHMTHLEAKKKSGSFGDSGTSMGVSNKLHFTVMLRRFS